jgi:hypothetical protein
MAFSQRQRRIVLAVSLILTLVAVVWVGKDEDSATPVAAVNKPTGKAERQDARKESRQASASELRLELLKRQPMKTGGEEMFAGKSWYVPPPPPPPLPPPPPAAPPLPFTYMGKLLQGDQWAVFLTSPDRNFMVKPGDVIEDTYRVEEVRVPMMTLTYLPLNMKQTLYIGEAN